MFIWSKWICGMLESAQTLIASERTRVKVMDGCCEDFAAVTIWVVPEMVSLGVPSIAMKMLWRSVERHRGMRAAGVEGTHDCRRMR